MEFHPKTQAFMYKYFSTRQDPDNLSPVGRQTAWFFAGVAVSRFLNQFKRA